MTTEPEGQQRGPLPAELVPMVNGVEVTRQDSGLVRQAAVISRGGPRVWIIGEWWPVGDDVAADITSFGVVMSPGGKIVYQVPNLPLQAVVTARRVTLALPWPVEHVAR